MHTATPSCTSVGLKRKRSAKTFQAPHPEPTGRSQRVTSEDHRTTKGVFREQPKETGESKDRQRGTSRYLYSKRSKEVPGQLHPDATHHSQRTTFEAALQPLFVAAQMRPCWPQSRRRTEAACRRRISQRRHPFDSALGSDQQTNKQTTNKQNHEANKTMRTSKHTPRTMPLPARNNSLCAPPR